MRRIVHRGTREIGGTCIEVAAGATRLILDVGLPLVDANRDPFDSLRALRSTREQLIADGTIRPITGLFTDDGPPPAGLLLSHAHLDHVGLLHHTRPEIPICATRGTSKMMLAGSVFANRPSLDRTRHREVRSGVPVRVGDFVVTPFAVDHSTFGCLAYLSEAGGKAVLDSGDLRRHGRKPGMIRTRTQRVAPRNVDVLLMAGTHLGGDGDPGLSEFDLEEVHERRQVLPVPLVRPRLPDPLGHPPMEPVEVRLDHPGNPFGIHRGGPSHELVVPPPGFGLVPAEVVLPPLDLDPPDRTGSHEERFRDLLGHG